MNEDFEQSSTNTRSLEQHWNMVRRRRWWIILPIFAIWALVWGVSWFLPAYYKSETLILVEQQKIPEQYVVPNVAGDLQDRLQSMTQQIMSRTRLLRIIDQFKLYASSRPRLTPEQIVDKMRKDIEIQLVQAPGRKDDLSAFRVSYSSRDPRIAQQVTNELTSLFIEDNLETRRQQSQSRKPDRNSATKKNACVTSRATIWESCRHRCRATSRYLPVCRRGCREPWKP